MASFKCPHCGWVMDIRETGLEETMATGLPVAGSKPSEVVCEHCGWVGTPADLKSLL